MNLNKLKKLIKNYYKNLGYYNVEVTLFEDFNQLNFVYVINSNQAEEQKILEKQIKDE